MHSSQFEQLKEAFRNAHPIFPPDQNYDKELFISIAKSLGNLEREMAEIKIELWAIDNALEGHMESKNHSFPSSSQPPSSGRRSKGETG
jgi:hypothetical protein